MAAKADTMSKTERQTLIRLVKQRFKLLETGLAARRSQLTAVTRSEVIAEHKAEAEKFEKRMEDEIMEPLRELVAHARSIFKDAEEAGLDRQGYGWNRVENILFDSQRENAKFIPKNLDGVVRERMLEKIGDKPMSAYALELEESKLIEDLLVGDLSSDDAKAFLNKVPTLEGLIPLPNGGANKALLAGEVIDQ